MNKYAINSGGICSVKKGEPKNLGAIQGYQFKFGNQFLINHFVILRGLDIFIVWRADVWSDQIQGNIEASNYE